MNRLPGCRDEARGRIWAVKRREHSVILIDYAGRWQVGDPHLFRHCWIHIDVNLDRLETGGDDGGRLRIGQRFFVEGHTGIAPGGAKHSQHWPPANGSRGFRLRERWMPGDGRLGHGCPACRRHECGQSDGGDTVSGVGSQTAHGEMALGQGRWNSTNSEGAVNRRRFHQWVSARPVA